MKFKRAPLLPELLRQVTVARENIAATFLRADKVRELVFEAARQGHRQLRIKLPDGIDVRRCEGTASFETWAADTGLSVSWESRSCSMPDGRVVVIWEPEITW